MREDNTKYYLFGRGRDRIYDIASERENSKTLQIRCFDVVIACL